METRATTASPDSTKVASLDINGNHIQDQFTSVNCVAGQVLASSTEQDCR
jgi:hypothetical protein